MMPVSLGLTQNFHCSRS